MSEYEAYWLTGFLLINKYKEKSVILQALGIM